VLAAIAPLSGAGPAQAFSYYAGLAGTFPFEEPAKPPAGELGLIVREPAGVVGALTIPDAERDADRRAVSVAGRLRPAGLGRDQHAVPGVLDPAYLQAVQMREEQTETAGVVACQGMLHNYLAAARDDQFLVEQDPHETAAPANGLPQPDWKEAGAPGPTHASATWETSTTACATTRPSRPAGRSRPGSSREHAATSSPTAST
jgi:hypothetical protein